MLKMAEINKMDMETVVVKTAELEKQLFKMKLAKHTTGIEKPHIKKELRKDIARLKTRISSLLIEAAE